MLDDFDMGFWHPFGPYAGLSAESILKWKSEEVERHGWTIWSFARSFPEHWVKQLEGATGTVKVLCSHSPNAQDPDPSATESLASHYRFHCDPLWTQMPMPEIMKVTNPFKRSDRATGFRVNRIEVFSEPVAPRFNIKWYCKKDNDWRSIGKLPTRGEYLIRRGGEVALRNVRAALTLGRPYIVDIKREL